MSSLKLHIQVNNNIIQCKKQIITIIIIIQYVQNIRLYYNNVAVIGLQR